MKLSRLKFWNTAPDALDVSPAESGGTNALSNVVKLPLESPVETPAGLSTVPLSPTLETATPPAPKAIKPTGLMAAAELAIFFENNFFGLGRHNGSHYKTQDAQEQGKAALISQFQNALAAVVWQKQAKVDDLRNMELQTDGQCITATAQLRFACTRMERDMFTLQGQMDLSAQGKGWVLAALNEYQIGFGKGLREAIDAELLGL